MVNRLAAALLIVCLAQQADGAKVWLMEIEGAIGPASADHFIRTLEGAEEAQVDLLVLRIDTPGGLDKSMRDMIKVLLASNTPVATFVAPNGARAASAGTYIMYASHIAAMAPATNIGSSTPVSIGGGNPLPLPGQPKDEKPKEDSPDEGAGTSPPATAMDRKVVNDAVAYIRSIAELRGRNVEWAEQTVREASNLPAREALELGVIDLVAEDLEDLLAQIDGMTVELDSGSVTIETANSEIHRIETDWRYELLSTITDPSVAYILLMIGIYGLIFEFYNPGTGVGGVVGVICLLVGAYALQMLPINYAGLALIVVGIGLMAAEAFTPSFGVLGVGGVAAFVIGSIILMDTDLPGYQVSMPIIAAVATASGLLVLVTIGAAVRARTASVVSGAESMIGAVGEVLEDFERDGRVRAAGEVWQARSPEPLEKGARVTVAAVDGVTLEVVRADQDPT
ncbi:MAG: nodulation protein NfeD [Gammaproteobacteria bacterium]|nr:nodulation protein NfeD [Gammaproteobacteria bacterium]